MAIGIKMRIAQESLEEQINCKESLQGVHLADQRESLEAESTEDF